MGALERLGAEQVLATVTGYRDALRAHQEALNRLNVYPVPDGDTGTNMALTMESVVAELATAAGGAGDAVMDRLCQAIGHGALMGARGNSGVILSQILRRLAEGFATPGGAGAEEVAAALRAASAAAYEAVMRPVEGTILTVARAAANGATKAVAQGKGLVGVLEAARSAAAYALARTPELLPVLKEAGVVDAGGAGFTLLLDVLLSVVAGRPVPEPPPVPEGVGVSMAPRASLPGPALEGPRYEVMFLLEATDPAVDGFRKAWADLGDSIVVVGGDGLWNCHIHTDDVGAAVEAGVDAGRPRRIRVTGLAEQVAGERCLQAAAGGPAEPEPRPRCAVVAVGAGDGIRRIFGSLGVREAIAGGQSMNPSTGQILVAVEAAPADEVVVLPNNDNVIPAAEMVGGLTAKTVRVVPTIGVAEGLAALLAYDPGASADENAAAMHDAAGRVVVGDVTRAVRPATTGAGPVAEGDWLGISRRGIEVVAADPLAASVGLLERLVTPDHELVTVVEGEGATGTTTQGVVDWLGRHRPRVSAEVHHGGQPVSAYLFSAE